jgi:ABC-2 type transport system ATP-binding protein
MSAAVEVRGVSKWYGQVIGLNDVTASIGQGVCGLLGPNGAGKSTLMKLITGQLQPSKGEVLVLGESIWNNYPLFRRIGFCPEQDSFYERMTGHQFLYCLSRLSGLSDREAEERSDQILRQVFLEEARNKKIAGYSKGMRQRIKLGQALIHDPELLILDEPLAGMDPFGRSKTIRLIRELGKQGKTVIVSSHILHEVESMTNEILLIHQGRILAEGNVHQIRELIDEHPHRISIHCDQPRSLAALLVAFEDVVSIRIDRDQRILDIESRQPDTFYSRLPGILEDHGVSVERMTSPDDNLQSVFQYLVK